MADTTDNEEDSKQMLSALEIAAKCPSAHVELSENINKVEKALTERSSSDAAGMLSVTESSF